MKLFGKTLRIERLNLNKIFLFCVLFFIPILTFGKDCNELRKLFLNDKVYAESDIYEFKKKIELGDYCYQNLMGIMVLKGLYFDIDEKRATNIFYDLSNKNYPEAQFNFALTLTESRNQKSEDVVNFILGLYLKYADSKNDSKISLSARDLGLRYISSLNNESLRRLYENSFANAQIEVTNKRFQHLKDTIGEAEKINIIVSILALGIIASHAPTSSNYSQNTSRPFSVPNENPWWSLNGNPLDLKLYQWPRP